jgi:NAD(P)-dependent dehydrogenase (short-subunit alcohol dehydrogenase family)
MPDQLGAIYPLGRIAEISEIVDAILYLDQASFVTGVTLPVDGGQSGAGETSPCS